MAVPRNRHSNARKKKKRSHMAKKDINTTSCSSCHMKKLPHRICPFCGFYKDKKVIEKNEKNSD